MRYFKASFMVKNLNFKNYFFNRKKSSGNEIILDSFYNVLSSLLDFYLNLGRNV